MTQLKTQYPSLIIDASFITLAANATVKPQDKTYNTVNLLNRFFLIWLDVASRGLSHHHVLSHPFKDWMTNMLDFPYHHEFIEFLGRWTHILIALPK
ncbi:hypothetical protein ACO0EY_10165, partial [Streptococcus pyogenes]